MMGSNALVRQAARRRRRRITIAAAATAAAAVVLVIVLLAVTGGLTGGEDARSGSVDSTEASIGRQFPDFTLTSANGEQVTKASLTGKKSIIWFVDQWTCGSCAPGAVQVGKLDDETGGKVFNVLLVFVTGSQQPSDLISWRDQYARSDWFVASDAGNQLANAVQIPCLDSKFLLNEDGTILNIDTQVTDTRYVSMLRSEVEH